MEFLWKHTVSSELWAIGSNSTKFPHQVNRSNYGVLCRGIYVHMSKIAGNLEWSLIKAGQVWYLQCKVFDAKLDIWEIRGKLQIWTHLLKKSLMKNFIFCAVLTLRKLRRWLAQKSFCKYSYWSKILMLATTVFNKATIRENSVITFLSFKEEVALTKYRLIKNFCSRHDKTIIVNRWWRNSSVWLNRNINPF